MRRGKAAIGTVVNSAETTFLFWNIHNNPVDEQLIRLINHEKIDVLILAESVYMDRGADLVSLINSRLPASSETFHCAPLPAEAHHRKVQILSRLQRPEWEIEFVHDRYTGWSFRTDQGLRLLMIGVHFPSVQYEQGDEQRNTAIELRLEINAFEARWLEEHPFGLETPLALIVGDFNASPFDAGIAGFYGLNASSSREIVLRQAQRTLNGRTARFLYNPMWRFLGSRITPGTYYKRLSSPICYDWYILDQVLISPALVPYFSEKSLQILTWDASEQFGGQPLTKPDYGTPNGKISDHLPVIFRFDRGGSNDTNSSTP